MQRRSFIKGGAGLAGALTVARSSLTRADVPDHNWDRFDFGSGPPVRNRLNQGPFGIDQDEGWLTLATTTPLDEQVKNFGLGLVGYAWEESGPSVAARQGKETLEQHVEKLATLPFVDVLYIRCDWRDVQNRPGRLDPMPIWRLVFDAAKAYNLRVGFRVQLSSPNIQPKLVSMPDFVREKVPLFNIGRRSKEGDSDFDFYEPQYDHPEFQKAFRGLTELLAAEFDNHPLVEFMDLMMYGFWGEGHTSDHHPTPFRDYLTAERTFVGMTELQLEAFKRIPIAVNTQPDISGVGNREVQDRVVRAGGWLRSDSIIVDEPIQIEELGNRPPWLAAIIEDGANRDYLLSGELKRDEDDMGYKIDERYRELAGLHALDIGANYFALWTEADNLKRYYEKYPRSLELMQRRMGYRVRPSWIWQRKRYDTAELVLGIANDGAAGVPGILGVYAETPDGKVRVGGNLDAGQPYAGKVRQASLVFPRGLDGEELRLRAEIEVRGVRHPVRWACREDVNPDGSLTVRLRRNDDPRFRKGV
jgi:hypothetical protein